MLVSQLFMIIFSSLIGVIYFIAFLSGLGDWDSKWTSPTDTVAKRIVFTYSLGRRVGKFLFMTDAQKIEERKKKETDAALQAEIKKLTKEDLIKKLINEEGL